MQSPAAIKAKSCVISDREAAASALLTPVSPVKKSVKHVSFKSKIASSADEEGEVGLPTIPPLSPVKKPARPAYRATISTPVNQGATQAKASYRVPESSPLSPTRLRKPSVRAYAFAAATPPVKTSIIGATADSMSSPYFYKDASLKKSKVYQKRLDSAAVLVQAVVRRFLVQNRMTNIFADYKERRANAKLYEQRRLERAAAVKITAVCRGHLGRMRAYLERLESRLQKSIKDHSRKLQQIEQWKVQQMEKIRRELHEEAMAGYTELEDKASAMKAQVQELRKENRALRKSNEALQRECKELRADNQVLVVRIKAYQIAADETRASNKVRMEENGKWKSITKLFQERLDKFNESLSTYNEHIEFEQKVNNLLQETATRIVERMDERLLEKQREDDEDLVLLQEVVLMANGFWQDEDKKSSSSSPAGQRLVAV